MSEYASGVQQVWENREMIVEDNGSDELIVIDKTSGVSIRISKALPHGLHITTQTGMLAISATFSGLPTVVALPKPRPRRGQPH